MNLYLVKQRHGYGSDKIYVVASTMADVEKSISNIEIITLIDNDVKIIKQSN